MSYNSGSNRARNFKSLSRDYSLLPTAQGGWGGGGEVKRQNARFQEHVPVLISKKQLALFLSHLPLQNKRIENNNLLFNKSTVTSFSFYIKGHFSYNVKANYCNN